VLETLSGRGALFFSELAKIRGLLPSRIEQALAELAAQGWVTSDSFEGLRALLLAPDKRTPFSSSVRKRRHKSVTSVEFAGRWSLLRTPVLTSTANTPGEPAPPAELRGRWNGKARTLAQKRHERSERNRPGSHTLAELEAAHETFARALLHRYGVVFRRLLERESFQVSWYELGRIYRRWEARGEIRGGYFVGGASGEQFALPEAIGLLRSISRQPANGQLIAISGADPLNLAGILTPGARVSAIAPNRLLLRDGLPIAALEGGKFVKLEPQFTEPDHVIETALRIGSMPAALRPYYA
jgi:ATP-dependent Lhr-like helicase